VCAILLVSAAGIWWVKSSRVKETSAWTSLASAQSAEGFADVAANHPGTQAALWAQLKEANEYLHSGVREAFTNREKAQTDLKKAKGILEKLVAQRSAPAALREQALYSWAKTLETTSDGDLAPAIGAYEKFVAEFPNSMYRQEAQGRIDDLKGANAQSFYAWFHAQNPKPPEVPKPQDGKLPTESPFPRLDADHSLDLKLDGKLPAGGEAKPKADEPPAGETKTPPPPEATDKEQPAAEVEKPKSEPSEKPAAPEPEKPQAESPAPQNSDKPADKN
jgi:hypothetical protein